MKNKKGFTLIELLAVIVILAIVSLITVPIVLNLIGNSKKSVAETNAKGFMESIDRYIGFALANKNGDMGDYDKSLIPNGKCEFVDGEYTEDSDPKCEAFVEAVKKKTKGIIPSSFSFTITDDYEISPNATFVIEDYIVFWDGKKAKVTGKIEKEIVENETEKDPIIPPYVKDPNLCEIEKDVIEDKEVLYIYSVEDMYTLSKNVNGGNTYEGKTIVLKNDLDFNNYNGKSLCDTTFEPIGNQSAPFKGVFDGNDRTIKNLKINRPDNNYVGIFGRTSYATIKNLTIDNIEVNGKEDVGSLIGSIEYGTVQSISVHNVKVRGNGSRYYSGIGGVIGYVSSGFTFREVLVDDVDVEANISAAGIVGFSYSSLEADGVLARNIKVRGNEWLNGVSNYAGINNIVVEDILVEGKTDNSVYSFLTKDNAVVFKYDVIRNKGKSNEVILKYEDNKGKNDISYYESLGFDTYIGGDNNETGYIFDYINGIVSLKSLKKYPLEFKLKGEGTSENPYIIDSITKWKQATTKLDKYYVLTKDLDFKDKNYYMMGSYKNKFTGTIDGNMKNIKNVVIGGNKAKYIGLFGYTDHATIKYLNINNIDVNGIENTGSLIGKIEYGTIQDLIIKNVKVKGNNSGSRYYSGVGGLIGYTSENFTFREVYVDGVDAEADISVGGIIGYSYASSLMADSVIVRNIRVKGGGYVNGISNQYGIDGIIVEDVTVESPSDNAVYSYYNKDNMVPFKYKVTRNKGKDNEVILEYEDKRGFNDISYYEAMGADTRIGGDNNDTGYYLDYESDTSNKIVLKKAENDPFNLEGDGSEANPYIVDSVDKWKQAVTKLDKHYKLTSNIDFNGKHFYMMGSDKNPFKGSIIGNMNEIKNVNVFGPKAKRIGVFGKISGGKISEVVFRNTDILGTNYVGGIVGYVDTATIIGSKFYNIKATAPTSNFYNGTGGIIGYNNSTLTMNDLEIDGVDVKGQNDVGGIMGYRGGTVNSKNILARNIKVSGKSSAYGVSAGSSINNIIVENVDIIGTDGSNYTHKTNDTTYVLDYSITNFKGTDKESGGNRKNTDGLNNISYYETLGLDTVIGEDDDSNGYYFDYENDTSNKIVLKRTKDEPIKFNLSGSGTESNPYIIDSVGKWKQAVTRLDKHYKVTSNLDFSGKHFYMMGSNTNKFTGSITGNMNKISNIKVGGLNAKYSGVFGYVDNAKISKLEFSNITSTGKNYIGGIFGYINKATLNTNIVRNIKVLASESNFYCGVGGLAGYSSTLNIDELLMENIDVTGTVDTSGIVGYAGSTVNSKNILARDIKVSGNNSLTGVSKSGRMPNVIVENVDIVGTGESNYTHYSESTTYVLDYSITNYKGSDKESTSGRSGSENIGNLVYYTNKIETIFNGDQNGTGYYFGYDTDGKIRLIKKAEITGAVSGGTSTTTNTSSKSCHAGIDMSSCSMSGEVTTAKICSEKSANNKFYWVPTDTSGSSTMLGRCYYNCNAC